MKKSIAELLDNKNIRKSHHRIEILEFLMMCECHPTADEIFSSLENKIPSLSKMTIYNTLHKFVSEGLIRTINLGENESRYEIHLDYHGHFKCNLCNRIYDIPVDFCITDKSAVDGFKIKEKDIWFKGICKSCLEDKKLYEEASHEEKR